MGLAKEAGVLAAAALAYGATAALPPKSSEAGSPCAIPQQEFIAITQQIESYIVDSEGVKPITHDGTFSRVHHDPKIGFILSIKGAPVACQTIWGLDKIKAYAMPSNTESLDDKQVKLPEDNQANEIPVDITLLNDGFLVKPQNPRGFPASSQIAVVMPLEQGANYIVRTFTTPPNSLRGDRWEIENK